MKWANILGLNGNKQVTGENILSRCNKILKLRHIHT